MSEKVRPRAATISAVVMDSPQHHYATGADSLLAAVDASRRVAARGLDSRHRALMGQFLTPASVAAMCRRATPPDVISLTAYEIDPMLIAHLRAALDLCQAAAEEAGIRLETRVLAEDFLEVGAGTLAGNLFTARGQERFDCAILNPPYRKIRTESRERRLLREIGIETSNLYTGFLVLLEIEWKSASMAPAAEEM